MAWRDALRRHLDRREVERQAAYDDGYRDGQCALLASLKGAAQKLREQREVTS